MGDRKRFDGITLSIPQRLRTDNHFMDSISSGITIAANTGGCKKENEKEFHTKLIKKIISSKNRQQHRMKQKAKPLPEHDKPTSMSVHLSLYLQAMQHDRAYTYFQYRQKQHRLQKGQ